jgi:hypothetical protein
MGWHLVRRVNNTAFQVNVVRPRRHLSSPGVLPTDDFIHLMTAGALCLSYLILSGYFIADATPRSHLEYNAAQGHHSATEWPSRIGRTSSERRARPFPAHCGSWSNYYQSTVATARGSPYLWQSLHRAVSSVVATQVVSGGSDVGS